MRAQGRALGERTRDRAVEAARERVHGLFVRLGGKTRDQSLGIVAVHLHQHGRRAVGGVVPVEAWLADLS
jgi:hypothetical protein